MQLRWIDHISALRIQNKLGYNVVKTVWEKVKVVIMQKKTRDPLVIKKYVISHKLVAGMLQASDVWLDCFLNFDSFYSFSFLISPVSKVSQLRMRILESFSTALTSHRK